MALCHGLLVLIHLVKTLCGKKIVNKHLRFLTGNVGMSTYGVLAVLMTNVYIFSYKTDGVISSPLQH